VIVHKKATRKKAKTPSPKGGDALGTALTDARALAATGTFDALLSHCERALEHTPASPPPKAALKWAELLTLLAIAQRKATGADPQPTLRRARSLGGDAAWSLFLEHLCFTVKDYPWAREASRHAVGSDEAWAHKVRIDALASLMSDDLVQAEKCLRLLHDGYRFLAPDIVQQVRQELAACGERAQGLLAWFGLVEQLPEQALAVHRAWWKALPKNWQKQFRVLLTRETGVDARTRAAKATAPLTENELRHVLAATQVHVHDEFPVDTLEPLQHLPQLTSLTLYEPHPSRFDT
jgi:hypothetical protein